MPSHGNNAAVLLCRDKSCRKVQLLGSKVRSFAVYWLFFQIFFSSVI